MGKLIQPCELHLFGRKAFLAYKMGTGAPQKSRTVPQNLSCEGANVKYKVCKWLHVGLGEVMSS